VAKRKGASPARRQKALEKGASLIREGKFGKGQLAKISTATLSQALGTMQRSNKNYNKVGPTAHNDDFSESRKTDALFGAEESCRIS
jgi:hypothetical protein